MAFNDRISSQLEDSDNERTTEKVAASSTVKLDDENHSIVQEVFDKFECFKQETSNLSSDIEHLPIILNRSISLWSELLNAVNHANEKNRTSFDQCRILVTNIFTFINEMTQLFYNDADFSREIFFAYFDLLNTCEIQEYFIISSRSTLCDSIRESNIDILLFILSTLCQFVHFDDNDLDNKYNALLNSMRIRVDQILRRTIDENSVTIHQRVLTLLWILSNHTLIIPSLLRAGLGESITRWLNNLKLVDTIRRPLIHILYNLSRHDQSMVELNKYGAVEVLNQLQNVEPLRQSVMFSINTMSLALLSTRNQIKNDPIGTRCIVDQLLQMTINASSSERYRYNGFHISEPLVAIAKLFVDDVVLDYAMNQAETDPPSNPKSSIHSLTDLLISFYVTLKEKQTLEQMTFIALINILWSISFHNIYQPVIQQDTELINIIQNVAEHDYQLIIKQYVPRPMQNVKKAADGILFNLGLNATSDSTSHRRSFVNEQNPLVMLSYSHVDSEFCDKILELLDEKDDLFDVWIDKRCCKRNDDIWESIAKGINNSDLIICIISSEYLTDKSCRQEIIYAKDRLNKPLLPIYLEKPEIDYWLDIRLVEFKYIRFENTNMPLDEQEVEELLSTVIKFVSSVDAKSSNTNLKAFNKLKSSQESIKSGIVYSRNPLTMSKSIDLLEYRNKPILKWTPLDIQNWFAQNDICPEIQDIFQFKTGAQMLTYAECFKDGWQKQYENYARRYMKTSPDKELLEHEFALFISALKQLLNDFDIQNITTSQQISNANVKIASERSHKLCPCIVM